mmetsp:Transcript_12483/g.52511  ORF Transcript_12483/g.52511 Transcript_12483/m.52511 type:complete len:321 (-) Transcript_12483:347-1309(-)
MMPPITCACDSVSPKMATPPTIPHTGMLAYTNEAVVAPTCGSTHISIIWHIPTVTAPLIASRPTPVRVSGVVASSSACARAPAAAALVAKVPSEALWTASGSACAASAAALSARPPGSSPSAAEASVASTAQPLIWVAATFSGGGAPTTLCISCVRTMCIENDTAVPHMAATTSGEPAPSASADPKNTLLPASATAPPRTLARPGGSPRAASISGEKTTVRAIAHDTTETSAPASSAWPCRKYPVASHSASSAPSRSARASLSSPAAAAAALGRNGAVTSAANPMRAAKRALSAIVSAPPAPFPPPSPAIDAFTSDVLHP